MKLIKPTITDIPGDNSDCVMGRSGELVGFNRRLAIWRYGFLNGSDMHYAFAVRTAGFTWIMATHKGKVLDRADNILAFSLPQSWHDVIEEEVTFAQSRPDSSVH